MLELMQMRGQLPMAQALLQEVAPVDQLHQHLKALTRRRKQLVTEHMSTSQRVQAELQATAPGLLGIIGQADNLWFLGFLICKADLRWLKTVRQSTLLKLRGVGVTYAAKIAQWQRPALAKIALVHARGWPCS